jgi:HD-GYP domain-containing protein (c-di-GMP phosphodiesterase class II)
MNALSQNADSLAGADQAGDKHYLRAVTDMAERCTVVARDALYTDSGIKLLDKGARVDSRLYERLVHHKLRGSIDEQLGVEDAITVPDLIGMARAQCSSEPLASMLAAAAGGADRLLAPLRSLPLPPPMAFKLTVMREQRPELLSHSVLVMLTALFLGLRSGLNERECTPLAAAALLHDIGVLHMDPVWRDPVHKVTGPGRKHLVAHPVTAMLVIRALHVYPKSVETAVLEHHERMDGTGYPRGLDGGQISPTGQILLLSEVVAAFFEKYRDEPAQRLSLSLRLNHRKFPPALTALLLPLLQKLPTGAADPIALQRQVALGIEVLSEAFGSWDKVRAGLPADQLALASGKACAYIDLWLIALQKALYEAGSHPRQQAEMLPSLQDDPEGLAELELLGREALWQLQSILDASYSRWPQLAQRADVCDAAVADWRDACAQGLGTA